MKITLLVAHHKPDFIYEDEIIKPIHVGSSISDRFLGILRDDSGDNISSKNPFYCELTATYWAWKNLPDMDFLGLCHYRRYFTARRIPFWLQLKRYGDRMIYQVYKWLSVNYKVDALYSHLKCKDPRVINLRIREFSEALKQLDSLKDSKVIIASKPYIFFDRNVFENFSIFLSENHFEQLDRIVLNRYPEYYDLYKRTLQEDRLYQANMLVLGKELFNEYCEFLFCILEEHETLNNPVIVNGANSYHRASGYIGELLTNLWIRQKLELDKEVELRSFNHLLLVK